MRNKLLRSVLSLVISWLSCSVVCAQTTINAGAQEPLLPITAAAEADRVRITAPSSIVQMHVEVYAASGERLFDNQIRGGNVFDWHLQDGQAQRLAVGNYVCVVTVKSLAGKLMQTIGAVTVGDKDVSVAAAESAQLSPQQSQAIGPVEENSSWTVLSESENQTTTVIAHDGTDGQIIRGRGAFSFRLGNFFSGTDKEQMRLTEDGRLGIGTSKPAATLDVAGSIRTTKGIEFADGTVQTTGLSGRRDKDGNFVPNAAGTGTLNRLAKWIETGGAGTLGDTVMTELNGNIGVGNPNPASLLHIGQFNGYGATTGLLLGNNLLGSTFDRSLQIAPVQVANPATNTILAYAVPTVNAGVTVPKLYGFFIEGKQGPGAVTSYSALTTGQGPSLGATNNTHLLMGQLTIPTGNFGIYEATGFKNFFTGNVGIGTNDPMARLHIVGATPPMVPVGAGTNASPALQVIGGKGGDTSDGMGMEAGKGGNIMVQGGNGGSGFHAFGGAGGDVILQGGIGGGGGGFGGSIRLRAGTGPSGGDIRGAIFLEGGAVYVDSIGDFRIDALGNPGGRFIVQAGGHVGIGADTPLAKFHIGDNGGRILFGGGGCASGHVGIGFAASLTCTNYSLLGNGTDTLINRLTNGRIEFRENNVTQISIIPGGRLGINTTAPDQHLTVNGGASKPGGGSWAIFSDERLKNIKGRFTSGLKAVMQLQPIRYEYKPNNALDIKLDGESIGFSAQAVQKIIPEAVVTNDKGYLLVNNDPIMWTMLNAIKEQQKQIQTLRETNTALSLRLRTVEKRFRKARR
jgi:hypothetical protein